MKKIIKILTVLVLVLFMYKGVSSCVYADFWTDANNWYKGEGFQGDDMISAGDIENVATIAPAAVEVIDTFSDMVNVVGTTVFVAVTIFLGIKYMFGSFEAKADVKESLVNLLVACVFFFGWNSIWNILFQNGQFVLTPLDSTSYESVVAKMFNTLTNLANFLAVGAVLYIGIRYIFAGATGKAELKAKSDQFIIGIVLSFCAVGVLNLVSTIINQVF